MTPTTRTRLQKLCEKRNGINREIEATIRTAKTEGGSLREIAEIVGLSHTEIRRILNKETPTQ